MAKLKIKSSITETAIKRFLETAKEGEELTCDRIKGFLVSKNRGKGSATFRYRPSARHISRSRLTIGRTNVLKIQEAVEIVFQLIEAINEGEEPKEALLKLTEGKLKKADPINDLSLLGNFYNQIYKPMRYRESGDSANSAFNSIEKHWSHLFDRPMNKIKPVDVQRWQAEKEKQGLKYVTIDKFYGLLNTVLNKAVLFSYEQGHECFGLLDDNPFKVRPLRKPSRQQKEKELAQEREYENEKRRLLETWELQKIEQGMFALGQECVAQRERSLTHSNKRHLPSLSHLTFPHWIIPFVYLAYYTGMRPGDIATLRWEDIQSGRIRKVTNKTKYQANPVTVSLDIVDVKNVMKYSCKEVLDIWASQMGNPKKGVVFPQDRNDTESLSEKGYKKSWDNVKELAGIHVDMYAFRHHFISTHIRKGTNLKLTATLAGHRTTEMIEKHYAHHFPADIRAALSIM